VARVATYQLQLYSSPEPKLVEDRVKKLREVGFSCRIYPVEIPGKGTWYRLRSGRYETLEEAIAMGERLKSSGLTETYWVIR
jgi:cell division protein FtsN